MYGFCSDVLRPVPSLGTTGTVSNGLATATSTKRKNARGAAEDRREPRQQVRVAAAAAPHGEAREPRQHETPQSSSEPACELQSDENW